MKLNHAALILLVTAGCFAGPTSAAEARDYHFDRNGISREVLEAYLDRAVTMAFYLVPLKPEGRRVYPFHGDDYRFIRNVGAKFIGRAIYRWGGESRLNSDEFWNTAKSLIEANDSNGHLQMPGCRMLSCPNESFGSYRANTKSEACPVGYSQEETIRQIWLK